MAKQKEIVLFGNGKWAEFLYYLFTHDSSYTVIAFTVDGEYLVEEEYLGLPVVAFQDVEKHFSPEVFDMHIGVGFIDQNKVRADRFSQAKQKGYELVSYVSSRSSVWPDLTIGENCTIHEGAVIQPFVKIGDNTQILSNANISHHTRIGDHCFIAGSAVLGGSVEIDDFGFIGMGATIIEKVAISESTTVAAGAVVTSDAEFSGLYAGIPAELKR